MLGGGEVWYNIQTLLDEIRFQKPKIFFISAWVKPQIFFSSSAEKLVQKILDQNWTKNTIRFVEQLFEFLVEPGTHR